MSIKFHKHRSTRLVEAQAVLVRSMHTCLLSSSQEVAGNNKRFLSSYVAARCCRDGKAQLTLLVSRSCVLVCGEKNCVKMLAFVDCGKVSQAQQVSNVRLPGNLAAWDGDVYFVMRKRHMLQCAARRPRIQGCFVDPVSDHDFVILTETAGV